MKIYNGSGVLVGTINDERLAKHTDALERWGYMRICPHCHINELMVGSDACFRCERPVVWVAGVAHKAENVPLAVLDLVQKGGG